MLSLLGALFGALIGVWLGRKYQRHAWGLDKPYKDRPMWDTKMGGMSVPRIYPKGSGRWL